MKIALLSDIHGNGYALDAVIKAAHEEGVAHFLITGDFIGYYYNIDHIMSVLDKIDYDAVRGNHEDMYRALSDDNDRSITARYGHSFDRCKAVDISSLLNLPEKKELGIDGRSILLCHGTPWDHDAYMYPDAPDEMVNRVFEYHKDMVVYGHTHYQISWKHGDQWIVNPGSVGQPRDYKPGASWALWNTESNAVELRREAYDIQAVIEDCMKYDPDHHFLRDVLIRQKAAS